MKKITIITMSLLLFAGGLSFAQSTKYKTRAGIVKEVVETKNSKNRFKYNSLGGVTVETTNEGRGTSRENGKFSLNILNSPFKIAKVSSVGYDLVSPSLQTTFTPNSKDTIEIVMVKSVTRKAVKANAKQDTEISISERKNKEKREVQKLVNAGKISQDEKLKRLNEIDEKYKKINEFVEDFLESYSYDYFNKMSDRTAKLYQFLIEGKLEQFDSLILQNGDLKKRKEKVKSLKELSDNEREALSKEYKLIADRYALTQTHDSVIYYMKERYDLDELNINLASEIAIYYNDYKADYDEALVWHYKALNIAKTIYDDENLVLANIYNNLGAVYYEKQRLFLEQKDKDSALYYTNKSLEIRNKHLRDDNPELIHSYHTKAALCFDMGEFDEALIYTNKSIDILENRGILKRGSFPNLYATKAQIYARKNKPNEALIYFNKALDFEDNVSDSLNIDLASIYQGMATCYSIKSMLDSAIYYANKGLKIQEKVLEPNNPALVNSYLVLANSYLIGSEFQKTIDFCTKAMKILTEIPKPLYRETLMCFTIAGLAMVSSEMYNEAIEILEDKKIIADEMLSKEDIVRFNYYNALGFAYAGIDDCYNASRYLKKALPEYIKLLGEDHITIMAMKLIIERCEKAFGE